MFCQCLFMTPRKITFCLERREKNINRPSRKMDGLEGIMQCHVSYLCWRYVIQRLTEYMSHYKHRINFVKLEFQKLKVLSSFLISFESSRADIRVYAVGIFRFTYTKYMWGQYKVKKKNYSWNQRDFFEPFFFSHYSKYCGQNIF